MSEFTRSVGMQFMGIMGSGLAAVRDAMESMESANAHQSAGSGVDVDYWVNKVERWQKIAFDAQKNVEGFERTLAKAKATIENYKATIENYKETVENYKETIENYEKTIEILEETIKKDREAAERYIEDLHKKLKQAHEQIEQERAKAKTAFDMGLKRLKREHEVSSSLREALAGTLALRCALEMQLLRADPDNPLLQDQDLRDRVRRAGQMAFYVATSIKDPGEGDKEGFDAAREAGMSFSVPGRPSGPDVLAEIALGEVYTQRLKAIDHAPQRALGVLHDVRFGRGASGAARDLLMSIEPNSPLLKEETEKRVRGIAMEEFQRQQQARRREQNMGGPNADWAAMLESLRKVRDRVLQALGGQAYDKR